MSLIHCGLFTTRVTYLLNPSTNAADYSRCHRHTACRSWSRREAAARLRRGVADAVARVADVDSAAVGVAVAAPAGLGIRGRVDPRLSRVSC